MSMTGLLGMRRNIQASKESYLRDTAIPVSRQSVHVGRR